MSQEILNKEEVITAIYRKFVSLDDCANSLDISLANLSGKLRRLTPKFIAQLEGIGVKIKTQSLNNEELKEFVDKTNRDIEKLKAKILDLKDEIEKIKKDKPLPKRSGSGKKLNKDEVLTAIYKRFDSLNECSEALSISRNNLYNKIGRLTPKFIAQLEGVGVEFRTKYLNNEKLKELLDKTNRENKKLKTKILEILDEIGR